MSNQNTRKQRKKDAKRGSREREERIKELQELKKEAKRLDEKISEQKQENFKQLNIRNLKIFGNTCNFLVPFVISTGVTVGAFSLFGGGLPFYKDKVIKYKVYDLDYETNGSITMEESYRTNRWIDDDLASNELVIYTPWEYSDGQYVRYKREYNVDEIDTLDLFWAVLEKNYDYISEKIKDYKEEVQISDSLMTTLGEDWFIRASLHMLDEEDILDYNETNFKNIVITAIELIIGLCAGGVLVLSRNFDYLGEVEDANLDYQEYIEMIDTSSGRHLEYISYDTSCDDKLIEYSTGWIINDYGLYERTVTSYRLNDAVNLEKTEKILSMTKEELEGILTVTNVRTIQKNSLDPEDSIYEDDAIIVVDYIESNDKTLTRLETNRENITHSFLCVLLTLILGWCIVCGKKVIFKTYIRDWLRGYASYFRQINEEELEKMKKILELEQKNLSMLRGESLNFGNDYGYSRKLRKDKRGGSNGE